VVSGQWLEYWILDCSRSSGLVYLSMCMFLGKNSSSASFHPELSTGRIVIHCDSLDKFRLNKLCL